MDVEGEGEDLVGKGKEQPEGDVPPRLARQVEPERLAVASVEIDAVPDPSALPAACGVDEDSDGPRER